jgi:ribonuclease D
MPYICRCPRHDIPSSLTSFLKNKHIKFVSVDVRTDKKVLAREWMDIPPQYHIDLQDVFKIEGTPYGRAGMAAMAGKLIDKKYLKMKKEFNHDMFKREGHNYWEWKPLSDRNLAYAILDGYVTYELYRRIALVNQGQMHRQTLAMCPCCLNRHTENIATKKKTSGWGSWAEAEPSDSSAKKRKNGWWGW